MSFDASRFSFHPFNDYLGVVMQQGRVQLDADWNEWVSELSRRLQAGTLDTVGRAVVPRTTPNGFGIFTDSGELTIGIGRMYVDGLLAENHGDEPLMWDEEIAEEVGTEPVPFLDQPYLPFNDEGTESGAEAFNAPDQRGGPHLVYLDVWQREITHLQDSGLVETAVGVDTTGRLQTVWQVKLLRNIGNAGCFSPDEEIPGWEEIIRPSGARLSTSTSDAGGEPNPCLVPPAAGYTGLENQLYRVEIHVGSSQNGATFKWSRDNGTVAASVLAIHDGSRLVVDSLGRDDVLCFQAGDWIEILDDWHELHGLPGRLHRIAAGNGVDRATHSIMLETALDAGLFPVDQKNAPDPERHTRIRRWDQAGVVRNADGTVYHDLTVSGISDGIPVPPPGTRLALENGIQVEFGTVDGGNYHSGDNWVFAARATDGTIEELTEAPPRGIHHHYARLAIVTLPGSPTNCRVFWPPEVGGDSCDCTVCVFPEEHNSGAATIQHAIDTVQARGGGTICLDAGTYLLAEPLRMQNVHSLRLCGKGWQTILRPIKTGQVLNLNQGVGVTLENFSIHGVADQSGVTSMLEILDSADLHFSGLTILATPLGRATAAAIGISGLILTATIKDCIFVAEQGLLVTPGKKEYLLTADLEVANNIFLCSEVGVRLMGACLHCGQTRFNNNLFVFCTRFGVALTGASLLQTDVTVSDNLLYVSGAGIGGGIDGLRIERNEIRGLGGKASRDGIILKRDYGIFGGLPIDSVCLNRNSVQRVGGNGISIEHELGEASITSNTIREVGGGAVVMEPGVSALYLRIEQNRFESLGLGFNNRKVPFFGVLLTAVKRSDISGNVVSGVAGQAVNSPLRAALAVMACREIRIAGNRLFEIGPPEFLGRTVGILAAPGFGDMLLSDNSVVREVSAKQNEGRVVEWQALQIDGRPGGRENVTSPLLFQYISGVDSLELSRDRVIYINSEQIMLQQLTPRVSVSGNCLRSMFTAIPVVRIMGSESCLFNRNDIETLFGQGEGHIAGEVESDHASVANNRFAASKDISFILKVDEKRLALLGNLKTGPILVNGTPDTSLAPPWNALNVQI